MRPVQPVDAATAQRDTHDYLAQWIFAAVDGQPIQTGETTWVAHVAGVHFNGADVWVQICRDAAADNCVVLQMPAYAIGDVRATLATLAAVDWAASPLVRVMPGASRPLRRARSGQGFLELQND
jgi:hypothetical protein